MKINVENLKLDFNTENNRNRENENIEAGKEAGNIEVGKLEVEIPTEEVLQYLATAPNVVKDIMSFMKDMQAMRNEARKEESKKVVTD